MSSRLLAADDPRPIAAVAWPVVTKDQTVERPKEVPAEPRVDLAQVEREWQRRVTEARAAGLREGEAAGRSSAGAEVQPSPAQVVEHCELDRQAHRVVEGHLDDGEAEPRA